MQLEVQDLRSTQMRLEEELLENGTGLQAARDKEMELNKDIAALRKHNQELKSSNADAVSDDREKRKAEMLSEMMKKIETVSTRKVRVLILRWTTDESVRKGGKSLEPGSEALESLLGRLDDHSMEANPSGLLSESKDVIRRSLLEMHTAHRELQDRLRRLQDDAELQVERREELERILSEKDAAYEDLLGETNCHCTAEN
jgi:kinesin family protein 5